MAITNAQIIQNECALHGIIEPINTYAGWKSLGMQVQRGQKALFTTQIWKPCKVKAGENEKKKRLSKNFCL